MSELVLQQCKRCVCVCHDVNIVSVCAVCDSFTYEPEPSYSCRLAKCLGKAENCARVPLIGAQVVFLSTDDVTTTMVSVRAR